MKIKEIIKKINKDPKFKDEILIGDFANKAFDIDVYHWNKQEVLTAYWIGNWYCTDTYVGFKVYFLKINQLQLVVNQVEK